MNRQVIYWIATATLAFACLGGGLYDITQPEPAVQAATKLGYPLYFFIILGCWKWGAVIAILSPALPRVKEWAYAGIFFNLSGASASHLCVMDPISDTLTPLVILAIAVTSWALRPPHRRLSGPLF